MMSAFLKRIAVPATGAAALVLGISSAAQAIGLSITAQASGVDSGYDRVVGETWGTSFAGVGNQFFSVRFNSFDNSTTSPVPPAFITSVTFDLGASGDLDASFDNQTLLVPAPPVVGLTSGINPANIRFSEVGRNGFLPDGSLRIIPELTIFFDDQDFNVGDSFTFGIDTNGVGNDAIPFLAIFNDITQSDVTTDFDSGADFALAGVQFLAEIAYGENGSQTSSGSAFFTPTGLYSSQANITNAPEPFTILGSALALGFGARLKKKRALRRQESAIS